MITTRRAVLAGAAAATAASPAVALGLDVGHQPVGSEFGALLERHRLAYRAWVQAADRLNVLPWAEDDCRAERRARVAEQDALADLLEHRSASLEEVRALARYLLDPEGPWAYRHDDDEEVVAFLRSLA